MRLDRANDWLSDKVTKRILYLGLIILSVNWPLIIYFNELAQYPVTFLESQLSFSATMIKSHYAVMSTVNIKYYILYQFFDIVYDLSYILIFSGFTLFLSRKFENGSKSRNVGVSVVFIGILGALCDVCENSLIIIMATNPQGFPDWLAIAHSCFATMKFFFWGVQAVWIIWAIVALLKRPIISKTTFFATLGVMVYQHWPIPFTVAVILINK